MGCEGCELWNAKTGVKTCYAGVLHVRFGGNTTGYSPTFEQVTFYPGRMAEATRWKDLAGTMRKDKPWMNGLPRLVFVSDMSDALSGVVSFEFLETEVIRPVVSDEGRRHRWLWLTKRPERMAKLSADLKARSIDWPENLWVGTSITSQTTTSRIASLLRVGDERTIRFLSVEPQQENIDLRAWLPRLDWIIQGGESGAGCRPFHVEWASDLISQCKDLGVAYFLKQLGSAVHREGRLLRFLDGHAGNWAEWPEHLRVRQMPVTPDVAYVASVAKPDEGTRISLDVIQTESKGRRAALKAWETRRKQAASKRTEGPKAKRQKKVG
jgi:protein gp37